MLLCDKEITTLARQGMIAPFLPQLVRTIDPTNTSGNATRSLSYGLSSYGYDVRLSPRAKIYSAPNGSVIDPKRPNSQDLKEATLHSPSGDSGEQYFIIPPYGYLLGSTVEFFRMPRNVTAIVLGKSTYARSLLVCNTTPIEAGFEGEVVIEISNPTPYNVRVYANEGIAQFLFLIGAPCEISYADRSGKYMGQRGITLSRM